MTKFKFNVLTEKASFNRDVISQTELIYEFLFQKYNLSYYNVITIIIDEPYPIGEPRHY